MNFASDNWAGATPSVMAALARHNDGLAPAYSSDDLSKSVSERISEIFKTETAVFFTATGTAANALALSAYSRPGGVIFCHSQAHINVDECGCPEFMVGGAKLSGINGADGKITPEGLKAALDRHPDGVVPHGQPMAVSISQATESGTVYRPAEIEAISAIAKSRGLPLHMDGARFANALVSLNADPADLTWRSGVDALSFGATKNGCWCAEAVVFFDLKAAEGFEYIRKRAGQVLSKGRFVAAQFDGYLDGGSWLETARHANAMATRLADGIQAAGGRLAWPVEANEVFPILKRSQFDALMAAGAKLYEWPATDLAEEEVLQADEVCLRLVASFATSEADVDAVLRVV